MTDTTTFKQLGIIDPILQVCKEEQFIEPTEIQVKSIPLVIAGKDVIGEAATGSGKTLAFATGIIQHTVKGNGIQALIITPTRELAQQVTEMIRSLSKYKPLNIIPIYGGVSINPQIQKLKRADIVIGTPGRLIDHIGRRSINLKKVKVLVLDECDRLLDMGFLPDVELIMNHLPDEKQTLLFSATVSFDISRLAHEYMNEPIDVEAESYVDPNKLSQFYYGPVEDSLKFSMLVHLLKQNTKNEVSMIFCNTRRYVDLLTKNLVQNGIKVTSIHGGFSQSERQKRLRDFQTHKTKVLVATDVAARGLDIDGVDNVFNYDLPDNQDQYIHRIGRTARAGNAGKAITLVSQRDNEKFYYLFRDHKFGIQKGKLPFINRVQFKRGPTRKMNTSRRRNGTQNTNGRKRIIKDQNSRYSL